MPNPNNTMSLSPEGLSLIKKFEGFSPVPYLCPAGFWTIGYGQRLTPAEAMQLLDGPPITEQEGHRALKLICETQYAQAVRQLTETPLTQNQFDAFVPLCYNIGRKNFADSTALRRANQGDYDSVPEAMRWWNKATVKGRKVTLSGLVARREAEALLWQLSDGTPVVRIRGDNTTSRTQGARLPEIEQRFEPIDFVPARPSLWQRFLSFIGLRP